MNVVVSGLQFHANIFPDANVAESWSKFPRAQQRLFDLLLQEGVQAPILISGDVHMTQLMRKDCERLDGNSQQRRSLVELTTSGMTHSWGSISSPPLSNPKQKPTLRERYGTFVSSTIMRVMHSVSPWTDLLVSSPPMDDLHHNGGGEGAKEGLQFSLEKNFGELEFDWEKRKVSVRSIGETSGAPPLLMASWSLDQLSGTDEIPGSLLTSQHFEDEANQNAARFVHGRGEWVCVNHRGSSSFLWQMVGHVSAVTGFTLFLPFPLLLPSCVMAMFLLRKGKRSSRRTV